MIYREIKYTKNYMMFWIKMLMRQNETSIVDNLFLLQQYKYKKIKIQCHN